MFNHLFNMGPLGIVIFVLVGLVILFLAVPYLYVLVRLLSKAWHKSKEEERKI